MDGEKMVMFSEEEVKGISGLSRVKKEEEEEEECVEVICGCTSRRYGDAVGTLRLFLNGHLFVTCDCTPGCQQGKLSPAAFEKHSERETPGKWKKNIWVIIDGEKVPLDKTPLLKYYDKVSKGANGSHKKSNKGRACHRDEFVRCTTCNKRRRFHLRNKEECRIYHDALADGHWKCADAPYDRINCSDEEERASRRTCRGCLSKATCQGCVSCVCFGCEICRFTDCSCQTCVDFTRNSKN